MALGTKQPWHRGWRMPREFTQDDGPFNVSEGRPCHPDRCSPRPPASQRARAQWRISPASRRVSGRAGADVLSVILGEWAQPKWLSRGASSLCGGLRGRSSIRPICRDAFLEGSGGAGQYLVGQFGVVDGSGDGDGTDQQAECRFANLAGVRSFTGFVPKIDQSGLVAGHKGITKAGDAGLRQALYMAADHARHIDPNTAQRYYRLVMVEGKHHNSALCSVSAVLITRIAACWRKGELYELRRLLGWHQDHRGATCLEPGRQGHPGVAGGLEDNGHRSTLGIFAHNRSRSVVVVRNFHDDQMNSPRSSARLARWSARQATSMPNLTSLMAWSFRSTADQSALRLRPLHVPQGCDHPDIREAGVRLH